MIGMIQSTENNTPIPRNTCQAVVQVANAEGQINLYYCCQSISSEIRTMITNMT
jgi:hypothetical protein